MGRQTFYFPFPIRSLFLSRFRRDRAATVKSLPVAGDASFTALPVLFRWFICCKACSFRARAAHVHTVEMAPAICRRAHLFRICALGRCGAVAR